MGKFPDTSQERLDHDRRLSARLEKRRQNRSERAGARIQRHSDRAARWASRRFQIDARASYPPKLAEGDPLIELHRGISSYGYFVVIGSVWPFRYMTPYNWYERRLANRALKLSSPRDLARFLAEA